MARRAPPAGGPCHLAVAGYAFIAIIARPTRSTRCSWFGGAIIAHDLTAFPLDSVLGLLAGRAAGLGGKACWTFAVTGP